MVPEEDELADAAVPVRVPALDGLEECARALHVGSAVWAVHVRTFGSDVPRIQSSQRDCGRIPMMAAP
jgi:hypothetical protein